MEKYEELSMEIISFDSEDVIVTSNEETTSTETPPIRFDNP